MARNGDTSPSLSEREGTSGREGNGRQRGMARTASVLVVDNDPRICKLAQRILTERGYAVAACAESGRAMNLLKETPYDCVLLDIRMEGLEGTELLPIIKRNFPTLPVIVISGYCEHEDATYYNSLGAFDVLTKPFTDERLVEAVNRAVGLGETIPLVLTSLSLAEARDQAYRKVIVTALRRTNWKQVGAARLLGISRYSLIRWLHRLQIRY